MVKVSVILPVYNGEKYVKTAIQSVLRQSYRCHECIVINDASTDATAEVLASFGDKIKVVHNEQNLERSRSRNRGLDTATGDFVAFIDADDVWTKQHIEGLVETYRREGGDVVYAYSRMTDILLAENMERLRRVEASEAKMHLARFIMNIQASMVRMEFVRDKGVVFPEQFRIAEDVVFFCKLLALGGGFKFVPKMTVLIRRHDENTTADVLKTWENGIEPMKYLVEWARENEIKREYVDLLNQGLWHAKLMHALHSLRNDEKIDGREPRSVLLGMVFKPFSRIDRLRVLMGLVWPYFPMSNSYAVCRRLFGKN